MRDGKFITKDGIVNLDPTKSAHWVTYLSEKFFVFYGCAPRTLTEFIFKRNGEFFFLNVKFKEVTATVQPIVYKFVTAENF